MAWSMAQANSQSRKTISSTTPSTTGNGGGRIIEATQTTRGITSSATSTQIRNEAAPAAWAARTAGMTFLLCSEKGLLWCPATIERPHLVQGSDARMALAVTQPIVPCGRRHPQDEVRLRRLDAQIRTGVAHKLSRNGPEAAPEPAVLPVLAARVLVHVATE